MKFPSKEEREASSIGFALGIVKDLTDPSTWWSLPLPTPESQSPPAVSSLPAVSDEAMAEVLDVQEEPVATTSSNGTSLGVLADVATSSFDDPDMDPIARLQRKQDRLSALQEQLASTDCIIDSLVSTAYEANQDLVLYQSDAKAACARAAAQITVAYNATEDLHRMQMAYHTISLEFVALAREIRDQQLQL